MKSETIGCMRAAAVTALLAFATGAMLAQEQAPPREPPAQQEKVARIGDPAPPFALKDIDDKEHVLADLTGKVVVLEWFNPDCPVVQMHYKAKTMLALREKFKDKEVVFLAINSMPITTKAGAPERNREVREEWKLPDILLLDRDGKVAKAYGAKVTPEMCVVDAEGKLAYRGAIDDGSVEAPGKTNYVELAVTSLLAKQKVAKPETTPYGSPIQM